MCCFMIKRSIRHILGRVGPIDMKWKGSVSIGCWANYVTSNYYLTHALILDFLS